MSLGPGQGPRPFGPLDEESLFVHRSEGQMALEMMNEGRSVALVGQAGTGKTAIAFDLMRRWDGAIARVTPSVPLGADEVARQLSQQTGQLALVVDDVNSIEDVRAALGERTGVSPWDTPTLVLSRNVIELPGYSLLILGSLGSEDAERFIELADQVDRGEFAAFIRETRGLDSWTPLALRFALALWNRTTDRAELARFLEAIPNGEPAFGGAPADLHTEPRSALLGPDGRPLLPGDPRYDKTLAVVRGVSDELLEWLRDDPRRVHSIADREFEVVVAELLARQGYSVSLTPSSKDGGRDIHAARNMELGSFLFLVECKKYAEHVPVGVELARQLYGVVSAENATAGIIVTTSRFTRGAKEFEQKVSTRLALRDFVNLSEWLAQQP